MLKAKFSALGNNIHRAWAFHVPDIIVWLALIFLVLVQGKDFFENKNFSQILAIFLTSIALSTGISSAVFSFAKVQEGEKTELVRIGQYFLYSSVSLIMALLISWMGYQVKQATDNKLIHFVGSFVFSSGMLFFVLAINSFHQGLKKLEKKLFFAIRDDIK